LQYCQRAIQRLAITVGDWYKIDARKQTSDCVDNLLDRTAALVSCSSEYLGCLIEFSVEARIDLGAELGEFKPSILQDLERDRRLEIDAMVTVVSEMGEIAGVQTPTIDTVLALLRGRARRAGLY
ncbi:MAG: hypothetical protein HOF99_08675, partial [Rhodospirillaceae bacterium]|nr:hypothetical protein [Rhodospirillaceae bacterium]